MTIEHEVFSVRYTIHRRKRMQLWFIGRKYACLLKVELSWNIEYFECVKEVNSVKLVGFYSYVFCPCIPIPIRRCIKIKNGGLGVKLLCSLVWRLIWWLKFSFKSINVGNIFWYTYLIPLLRSQDLFGKRSITRFSPFLVSYVFMHWRNNM